MKNIIKKSEARRRDESQLSLYHQAHERLTSGKPDIPLQSGGKESLLSFVSARIDEVISRLV